jgi:hypothetical protein
MTKYIIFNKTDGIIASQNTFPTKKKAESWIKTFKAGIKKVQGYYFTSSRERIPVYAVEFEIIEERKFWSR